MQPERLDRRQIPPELVLLPHQQRELATIDVFSLRRDKSQNLDLPLRGIDQPGEHFQGRRFARAVRPQEADHLAPLDVEADSVHGVDVLVATPEE